MKTQQEGTVYTTTKKASEETDFADTLIFDFLASRITKHLFMPFSFQLYFVRAALGININFDCKK